MDGAGAADDEEAVVALVDDLDGFFAALEDCWVGTLGLSVGNWVLEIWIETEDWEVTHDGDFGLQEEWGDERVVAQDFEAVSHDD